MICGENKMDLIKILNFWKKKEETTKTPTFNMFLPCKNEKIYLNYFLSINMAFEKISIHFKLTSICKHLCLTTNLMTFFGSPFVHFEQ